jgi:hypothetical protein
MKKSKQIAALILTLKQMLGNLWFYQWLTDPIGEIRLVLLSYHWLIDGRAKEIRYFSITN